MPSDKSRDLNASVSAEQLKVADQVQPAEGLVAVLDALGVSLFSLDEAREFVRLRDSIITFTEQVIETRLSGLDMKRLTKFTLNDTVVFAYQTAGHVTLDEVEQFCHVLRLFETRSIVDRIPFRGALGLGPFYIGDSQTVLGPAVVDAASWYERADWIGIHATPHATMFIQSLLERSPGRTLDHVLLDYDVPIKDDKSKPRLKAVNWPKGFYMKDLRPPGNGTTRGLVLTALAKRRVPKGTEAKYFHAVKFFDDVEEAQHLEMRR
jgi:hypothetical protein